MVKVQKKRLKKSVIFKSFSLVLFLVCLIFLFLLNRIGVLPIKYFILVSVILFLFNFVLYRFNVSKKWQKRMVGSFLCVILTIIFSIGIFYESVTLGFFGNAFQSREKVENYQVLVLESSNYESLKEFKNGKIGVPKTLYSEGAKLVQNEVKKRTTLTLQEMDNYSLLEALVNKNLRVVVMEEAQKNLFCEMDEEFQKNIKVIETIPVTVQNKVVKKNVAIAKNPFHIYVSGNDDYGAINNVSRSDVNMILTVNPKTNRILITSIPRDYYVVLSGMEEAEDKLTHASLFGIDTSIETLNDLFDIDIDYYLKINFSSLVNLVEAVDGIDVESNEEFTAHFYDEPLEEWVTYSYNKGLNHLNGKEALAFARERKSFALGDRARAEHQQMVLKSLIKKIASPAILTNYTSILKALDGTFDTNLGYEEIMAFLQKQLDDGSEWTISSNLLEGTDDNKPVYSLGELYSYVMIPDEESVANASLKMKEIINS